MAAAEQAINSPLLETTMEGATGVLLSISGGSDLGMHEVNEAAGMVQEQADDDVNLIFGTTIDDNLGDEVRVTIVATGFDAASNRNDPPAPKEKPAEKPAAEPTSTPTPAPAPTSRGSLFEDREQGRHHRQPDSGMFTSAPRPEDDGDDLDIPDFMR